MNGTYMYMYKVLDKQLGIQKYEIRTFKVITATQFTLFF